MLLAGRFRTASPVAMFTMAARDAPRSKFDGFFATRIIANIQCRILHDAIVIHIT